MELPYPIEKSCPNCGDDSEVWAFEKREGTGLKECFTCDACGCEWSEMNEH